MVLLDDLDDDGLDVLLLQDVTQVLLAPLSRADQVHAFEDSFEHLDAALIMRSIKLLHKVPDDFPAKTFHLKPPGHNFGIFLDGVLDEVLVLGVVQNQSFKELFHLFLRKIVREPAQLMQHVYVLI